MRIWNKIKYPLLIGLIVLFFAFLRFLAYALPSWSYGLVYPLMVIRLLSQDWFDSDILLDIALLAAAFFAVMFVPMPEKWGRLRRYILRPILSAVMVVIISLGMSGTNEQIIEHNYDLKIAKAEQLIEEADEIIYYNLYSHQGATPRFTQSEIIHTCGHSHDMILIDYDTHRVTFLRELTAAAYLEIDTFQLQPTGQTEFKAYTQVEVELTGEGAKFITHFPDLDNPHRTSGIVLHMADGSVYALTDLIDPAYDYPYFLGLDRGEFDENKITCS